MTDNTIGHGLPSDPVILAGIVNTRLRDFYDSLDALCDDLGIDRRDLERVLGEAGFEYMPETNQFR